MKLKKKLKHKKTEILEIKTMENMKNKKQFGHGNFKNIMESHGKVMEFHLIFRVGTLKLAERFIFALCSPRS
jgi:hypothetical protein